MSYHSKQEKEEFTEKMRKRTKQFAIDVIHFCDTLPPTQACRTISFQLIKAATSTGANYRASCRARSKAEFYSKISITVEEADESEYWLEVIEGSKILCDRNELKRLLTEVGEILKIVSTARKNSSAPPAPQ
ncbi:MAG: four helix bundle protein [Lewinellaceae bacterium]|nr:four helix bundle protein [Saprospiraceae bacterium]MCB9337882.1 four helix bundle protein [Lewinellaceae bacterium]